MTTAEKERILYDYAHGKINSLPRELKKYRVTQYEGNQATHSLLRKYVTAVDSGKCHLSFLDWRMNNGFGNRATRSGKEEVVRGEGFLQSIGCAGIGWMLWGLAIYWFLEIRDVGTCIVAGIIVSVILSKISRNWIGFTMIVLPIVLMIIGAS